eukprot:269404-Hanusia_phi.AAC.2
MEGGGGRALGKGAGGLKGRDGRKMRRKLNEDRERGDRRQQERVDKGRGWKRRWAGKQGG